MSTTSAINARAEGESGKFIVSYRGTANYVIFKRDVFFFFCEIAPEVPEKLARFGLQYSHRAKQNDGLGFDGGLTPVVSPKLH